MEIFYYMAVIGSVVSVILLLLQATGLFHLDFDGDLHLDHDHSETFLNVLSIKNIAYFATLGGWSSVWLQSLGYSNVVQVIGFAVGGVLAVFMNITLMYLMNKLNHKPIDRPEDFVGAKATCTVTIQPHSPGLVQVAVNGRLSEYVAKSSEVINPGESCTVKQFINNTVEVHR